jgi:hypothetical protein
MKMSRFVLSEKGKKKEKEKEILNIMRKEKKERKKKMRARRARLDQLEKEELMWWTEKEKKHGTAREKWMDRQEHEVVMLNLSIMAEKLSDDRLVEEQRTPVDMFWKCWDSKQIERSRMGEKQREEVKKIVNKDC